MALFVAQKSEGVDHEHLVVANEQAVECAKVEGHSHIPSISPETGEIILDPMDGHSHIVVPYEMGMYTIPDVRPELDDDECDVIKRKSDQFIMAYDAEEDSIEKGRESVRFRENKQWEDSTRQDLANKNRACLTINHVAPMVETLSGLYRRNISDLRCFPTENGDNDIATVLTYVMKHILDKTEMSAEEIEVFEDMVTAGRGVFELYPEFDTDIRGAIRVKQIPWDMVVFAPHIRKDGSDCEYFCRWNWLSQEQLENMFPEKAEDIELMYGRFEQFIAGSDDLSDLGTPLVNALFADKKTREMRLVECEEKMYYRLRTYVDPMSGFKVSDAELPTQFRSQMKTITLMRHVDRKLHAIRRTVLCGDVLVEDDYVERPVPPHQTGPSFSAIPAYAYKRGAVFQGKVERTKDSQREINKRRSQIVDIVNTSITNGWFVPKGSFGSQRMKDRFKRDVSKPGFIIDLPDITNVPQKVESSRVEPAIVQLEMNSTQSFRETSNVNVEMLGMGSQYQSGSAMAHRMQQGLMGNEYLFDNISRVKKRLGREILLWIQELYTTDRIARIFFDQAKLEKIYMGDQEVDPNDVAMLQSIEQKLKDADLSNYDITIGETGQSPTAQLANFDMMVELAGKGVPIPPMVFIEMAPIPNKQRIIQLLQQASEQDAQAEDKKYDTEIQKTMIAAQSKSQG